MPERKPPKLVGEVVETLRSIYQCQKRVAIVELLERAHAYFDETDYDNWNGGTYTWALRLEVPVPIFAVLEPQLNAIETDIGGKLGYLERLYVNDRFGEVTITPISPGAAVPGQRRFPSELEVQHLWPDGRFRLFLSHLTEDKVAVSKLKDELALRGVAAFVAHEDIEPSREWCDEIELALRSMHALAALITPNFHASKWTDQEIGWALGRGIPVVPVRLGCDPYGFAGKYQGVSVTLEQPGRLAIAIINALLAKTQTHGEMRRALVNAFSESNSFAMAKALRQFLVKITDFTDEDKAILWKACAENSQVINAFDVVAPIYSVIGNPPTSKAIEVDDDIPF